MLQLILYKRDMRTGLMVISCIPANEELQISPKEFSVMKLKLEGNRFISLFHYTFYIKHSSRLSEKIVTLHK
jgi:hypothetical protein